LKLTNLHSLSSFDQTFEGQRYEVLNYVFDPVVDGKWYVETTEALHYSRIEQKHKVFIAGENVKVLYCIQILFAAKLLHASYSYTYYTQRVFCVQHTTSCPLCSIGTPVQSLYTTPGFTFDLGLILIIAY
jgi:hypothetical protein